MTTKRLFNYLAVAAMLSVGATGCSHDNKSSDVVLFPIGIDYDKTGFIDADGNVVIAPCLDYVEYNSDDNSSIIANVSDGFFLIDKTGKKICDLNYDDVDYYSEGYARVKKNGRYGFIDNNGKEICKPKYYIAYSFSEGMAVVADYVSNGMKYGFIDKRGKEAIKAQFDYAGSFSEGMARIAVIENGMKKYGFIDKTGKIVIEPQFGFAEGFSEGFAKVMVGDSNKYGFIDQSGKMVIEPQFDDVSDFENGLAVVSIADEDEVFHRVAIDKTGKFVFGPGYEVSYGFDGFVEGMARVYDTEKSITAFADESGKTVFELSLDHDDDIYDNFSEGLLRVRVYVSGGWKYGFVDKSGKMVIEPQYDYAQRFSEGLALIGVGDDDEDTRKYGFIDKSGKIVIEPQFEDAESFDKGLASVRIEKNGVSYKGYVNKEGTVVWPR